MAKRVAKRGFNTPGYSKEKIFRDTQIIKMRSEGATYKQIAEHFNLSPYTVTLILNRPDVKSIFQSITDGLVLESAPLAYANIHNVIKKYPKTRDKTEKQHGFQASMKVLEATGHLATEKPSVTINNLYNQTNTIIDPVVADVLQKHFGLERLRIEASEVHTLENNEKMEVNDDERTDVQE